ncbi:hypothetical protein B9057_14490 (plasmid) [Aestuarium zhoushanense]|nr:hypothetical protein B9057_14490 [Aestuarium zhoushanense]
MQSPDLRPAFPTSPKNRCRASAPFRRVILPCRASDADNRHLSSLERRTEMLYTPFAAYGAPDPFSDMRRVQNEMNRLFEGLGTSRRVNVYPPVNFWAGQDSVVMTAELPGLAEKDIELTVKDTLVSIKGTYPDPDEGEETTWYRRERPRGSFSRSVELPFRVDSDRIEARFQNGVLTIEMQRPEDDKPKRIEIKAS